MNGNSILDDFKNAWNRPNNAVIQIIFINLFVYLTFLILGVFLRIGGGEKLYEAIISKLMLPWDLSVFLFQPWAIITYFFLHEGFWHILWNMVFLYWFGKLITEFLGSNKVISLYVLGGIFGGLFYMLMYNIVPFYQDRISGSLMLGASAGVYAVVVGAATFMPNHPMYLWPISMLFGPIRIKYIALFSVIMSFRQIDGSNAGGELAHLAGAGLGFIYITQLRKGNDLGTWVINMINFFKSFFTRQPKIKVTHKSGMRTPSQRKSKPSSSTSSSNVPIADQNEIDAILDKISQSGYESLSKDEKQKLFNASKK